VLQVTIGVLVNIPTISPGMNLGFSAVALPAMQSANHTVTITEDEASWIGKVLCFLSVRSTGLLFSLNL
jgi:hypothetical protein